MHAAAAGVVGGGGEPTLGRGKFPRRRSGAFAGGSRPAGPALGTGLPARAEKFAARIWAQRKKPLGWRRRGQS